MKNVPKVKLGIIAVSRDCFPIELSRNRRKSVVEACYKHKIPIAELQTIIENETDVLTAIKEMARFYRHVLIEKRFPHHTAVAFKHSGKTLYEAAKLLGIDDISFNLPNGILYRTENPF